MLQLKDANEMVFGDATDYASGNDDERHIILFNPDEPSNHDSWATGIIFAENPEEIIIYSKNEKDSLKIVLDFVNNVQTIFDSSGEIMGYFDEGDLVIYDNEKKECLKFSDMSFLDKKDTPYGLITDDIENDLTEEYFSRPHLLVEFVESKVNNVYRNLIIASLIILSI